jgi:chitinase
MKTADYNLPFVRFVILAMLGSMVLSMACFADDGSTHSPGTPSPMWVTGYYLSDDTDKGRYPVSKIDFHAMTHMIDFCNFPGPDGTLDPQRTISPQQSAELIGPAHAAGCKVLVSLGTDDGLKYLHQDVSDAYRPVFVKTLVQFVMDRGYDGLDLDYEPIVDADVPNFVAFIQDLRSALDAAKPGLLLTVAAADQPAMYAKIQNSIDQINLMSYSESGLFQNFKSWYDSNLYGDQYSRMENFEPYPSCDQMVQDYINKGVNRSKIGLGIAFGGVVWTGVTCPRQSIKELKDQDVDDGDDYRDIMAKYYKASNYHWDPITHAAYLSFDGRKFADKKFIPYDDPRSCAEKVNYAETNGLGGVMMWEIGAGYRPDMPSGKQDEMLQAVKKAAGRN